MSDKKTFFEFSVATSRKEQMINVTEKICDLVRAGGIRSGLCCIHLPHTTAALTINENADPDVPDDIISGMRSSVDDSLPYRHVEGNSPAHIRSSLFGVNLNLIINDGRLMLGTWQGVFLCEFDGPRKRNIFVKIVEG